jgi:hypothetical protein
MAPERPGALVPKCQNCRNPHLRRDRGSAVTAPRSCLAGAAAGMRDPDPANARAEAKKAWHRDGLILINPAWLNGWADKRQAEMLAEKLHGRRGKSNDRVLMPAIDSTIQIQCRSCLGDGWCDPLTVTRRLQRRCVTCGGDGVQTILMIARRATDEPPRRDTGGGRRA